VWEPTQWRGHELATGFENSCANAKRESHLSTDRMMRLMQRCSIAGQQLGMIVNCADQPLSANAALRML
jgi:hypothetical protein